MAQKRIFVLDGAAMEVYEVEVRAQITQLPLRSRS